MVYQANLKYLQSQRNSIKNNDNVKLLLTHMKKLQNSIKIETSTNDKIVSLVKDIVDRKKVDVSIKLVIFKIC